MSYLKDREIWLSSVPTGNPPAGYVWVFIQNGVFVVRDSNGVDKIMATTTGTVTNATSASYVEYSNVANKPALISGSSQVSYTGLSNIPAGIVSGSSQVSFNGIVDKPTLVSGSSQITYSGISSIPAGIVSGSSQVAALGFATTGSNTFQANQTITGSLFITQNLVVAGSSSIQYISSSVLDIADNIITVNAFNPAIRFGGIAVIDSGSSPQVSGSLLFDSIKDQWIFVHQNQSVVTSSVLLMGPETYNDLGNESYISANRLPKGSGVEHLRDSNITDTGTVVSVNSNTAVTGSFTVVSGSAVELQVTNLGVNIGSALTDSHIISGSLRVNPNGLFVSGSGNVGIGTTNPGTILHLVQSGGPTLRMVRTSNRFDIAADNDFMEINARDASTYMIFKTVDTERMRITSGGNVLIGATSDISSGRREIVMRGANGSVVSLGNNTTADRFQIASDSGENALLNNKANTPMIFYTNNTEYMRITSGGNVGIGTTTPSNLFSIERSISGTGLGDGMLFKMKNTSTTTNTRSGINFGNIDGIGGSLAMQSAILKNAATGEYDMTWDLYGGAAGWKEGILYIDSNPGNVGIGTTGPSQLVEASRSQNADTAIQVTNPNTGGSATAQFFASNGTNQTQFYHTGTSYGGLGAIVASQGGIYNTTSAGLAMVAADTSGIIRFATGGTTERMRITSGGSVLIGHTSATYSEKALIQYAGTGNQGFHINQTGSTGANDKILFSNGNGIVGYIRTDGSATSYVTTSDYRLKEDFQEINGLKKVSSLKVYNFKWLNSEDRTDGVIAHELAEVLPYAVSGEKDGEMMQGVDYSKLVPVLVKAVQELKSENDNLKSRLEVLEQS